MRERELLIDTSYPALEERALSDAYVVPIIAPVGAIALQVDQQIRHKDRPATTYGAACTGVAWAKEVEPLSFGSAGVALSDLLPFSIGDVLEAREGLADGFSVDGLTPYLQASLAGQTGLGVYFEVYAATDLEDDYMIEYQVTKRMEGGILQRGRTRTSLFHARRTVVDQRLPAAFLIDSAEWRDAREIDVVVTVTNLVTGAEISRTLPFTLDGQLVHRGNTKEADFFDLVYEVVAQIPFGHVTTYGHIAEHLGTRGSARAVGWALNKAAGSSLPCHRVVNRRGALTGKRHFETPDAMEERLRSEGVTFNEHDEVRLDEHLWLPADR